MLRSAASLPRRFEYQPIPQTRVACIVDPQAGDYRTVGQAAAAHGVQMHVVATPQEALRLARSQQIHQWVVNTDLPGLSGFELCGMLKAQSSRATVCLVANEYSVAAEQAAWRARATMFLCKGSHVESLSEWLTSGAVSAPTA